MKQFDLQGNEYDIQIRDMIEPIENWQYVSGTRDIGKSYFQNLLNEKDKEIERLNNIIKKLERLVDDYAWNSYYIKCGNRYLKSEILNDIREIIELKGSDKVE